MRMTVAEYSSYSGIPAQTIYTAIRRQEIVRGPDGRLESDDVDRDFRATHEAREQSRQQGGARLQVLLAARLSKMQLAKQEYEARNASLVDRQMLIADVLEEVDYVDDLRAHILDQTTEIAAYLGIDIPRCTVLLRAFVDAAAAELGDLAAEVRRVGGSL